MAKPDRLFLLATGVLEPEYDGDRTPLRVLRHSLEYWLAKVSDESLRKGIVDVPEGYGKIYTLVAREV